ncbi:nicotinamide riboside transporter PnuC [Neptunicella sp. SCSIO 80796]|uniref:nicotinamide riboside transporter PnuC n=1 Tax=Neptunicella plasticusilytica TaxID=3117012 RepID=UPI003A4DD82E
MDWQQWFDGFAGASPVEWIATLCGFVCVYLLIQRNIWSFAFGFVQVSLYAWIFFGVKLYSDMLLHLFYMGFQIYGWRVWSKSADDHGNITPDRGTFKQYMLWVLVALVASAALGNVMANATDASFPYADAFTTCASLVAQWLLSHRKLFNWLFWIVVDVVAITIYWQKGLYPTSALYLCFLVMSSVGQWRWWLSYFHGAASVDVDTKQTGFNQ